MARGVEVSERKSPSPAQTLLKKYSFAVGRKPSKEPKGRLLEGGVKASGG